MTTVMLRFKAYSYKVGYNMYNKIPVQKCL